MKDYKEKSVYLGGSDVAELLLRGAGNRVMLHFGGDGDYTAWVINEGDDIPAHYHLVADMSNEYWIWIYDDEGRTIKIDGGADFYRAGEYGCLIVLAHGAKIENI